MIFKQDTPFFIFDVESVGLHGIHFAVAGGVYINGVSQWEFEHGCPIDYAVLCGEHLKEDIKWVKENVQCVQNCPTPGHVTDAFWVEYRKAKEQYPNLQIAAECLWPVEGKFFNKTIEWDRKNRNWDGPYPFHEIASIMACAGLDPMEAWDRLPEELPVHNPLADARLSARILKFALGIILHQQELGKQETYPSSAEPMAYQLKDGHWHSIEPRPIQKALIRLLSWVERGLSGAERDLAIQQAKDALKNLY